MGIQSSYQLDSADIQVTMVTGTIVRFYLFIFLFLLFIYFFFFFLFINQLVNIVRQVQTIWLKEHLLLIGKSSPCGFPLSLSEWSFAICPTPYNRK